VTVKGTTTSVRKPKSGGPPLRSAAASSAAGEVRAQSVVPFEIHGDLSDEAIEALAALLLAITDQDQAEPAGKEDER
jgi:hypothetical protein